MHVCKKKIENIRNLIDVMKTLNQEILDSLQQQLNTNGKK